MYWFITTASIAKNRNTLHTTFQHLVAANGLIHGPPPLHRAPLSTLAQPSPIPTPSPSSSTIQNDEIKMIQGRTFSSKNLLHTGFCYSTDGKPLLDGRQS